MGRGDRPQWDRRQPRLPARLKVAWRGLPARFDTQTIDLSAGGLALETSRPLPLGIRFGMVLSIEGVDLPAVEVLAEVVNVRHKLGRYFVGVRFCDLDPADDSLARLVEALITTPEDQSRRRHPRVRVRVPAREMREDSPDWQLEELSLAGLRIERLGGATRKDLEPGAPVTIEVKFPDTAVTLACSVIWMVNGADGGGPRVLGLAFEPPAKWAALLADVALGRNVVADVAIDLGGARG